MPLGVCDFLFEGARAWKHMIHRKKDFGCIVKPHGATPVNLKVPPGHPVPWPPGHPVTQSPGPDGHFTYSYIFIDIYLISIYFISIYFYSSLLAEGESQRATVNTTRPTHPPKPAHSPIRHPPVHPSLPIMTNGIVGKMLTMKQKRNHHSTSRGAIPNNTNTTYMLGSSFRAN